MYQKEMLWKRKLVNFADKEHQLQWKKEVNETYPDESLHTRDLGQGLNVVP